MATNHDDLHIVPLPYSRHRTDATPKPAHVTIDGRHYASFQSRPLAEAAIREWNADGRSAKGRPLGWPAIRGKKLAVYQ